MLFAVAGMWGLKRESIDSSAGQDVSVGWVGWDVPVVGWVDYWAGPLGGRLGRKVASDEMGGEEEKPAAILVEAMARNEAYPFFRFLLS